MRTWLPGSPRRGCRRQHGYVTTRDARDSASALCSSASSGARDVLACRQGVAANCPCHRVVAYDDLAAAVSWTLGRGTLSRMSRPWRFMPTSDVEPVAHPSHCVRAATIRACGRASYRVHRHDLQAPTSLRSTEEYPSRRLRAPSRLREQAGPYQLPGLSERAEAECTASSWVPAAERALRDETTAGYALGRSEQRDQAYSSPPTNLRSLRDQLTEVAERQMRVRSTAQRHVAMIVVAQFAATLSRRLQRSRCCWSKGGSSLELHGGIPRFADLKNFGYGRTSRSEQLADGRDRVGRMKRRTKASQTRCA